MLELKFIILVTTVLLSFLLIPGVFSDVVEIVIEYDETLENPQWSYLIHTPDPVVSGNSADIDVEWYDNTDLHTVIIYENSTGSWTPHYCDVVTGICT